MTITPDDNVIFDYNFEIGEKVFIENIINVDNFDNPFSATIAGIIGIGVNKQYIVEITPETFKILELLSPNINIKTRPGYVLGIVDPDELTPAYRRLQLVVNNERQK